MFTTFNCASEVDKITKMSFFILIGVRKFSVFEKSRGGRRHNFLGPKFASYSSTLILGVSASNVDRYTDYHDSLVVVFLSASRQISVEGRD
jgi:hypothetical protein